ncbi:VOC family protein [Robertmurraya korlensis]|uniref:VOC family protein n=1 Tax=Robertmurraya korlensis TaxID=519977 RepID=UPI000824EA31|nr:VOC family protein [Robertmurraya korlensis]
MKIEHIAIWVKDLEKMKAFYERYFNGKSNEKYHNVKKGFESYFIQYESGARLEIMRKTGVDKEDGADRIGWAHVAFSLGSKEKVNELTAKFQEEGYVLIDGPRVTGDGYYESVIEDPEGNLIELTI